MLQFPISVIMPVYNVGKIVTRAISSILNQTFTDFEFIIINDCSTDRTLDIIKSFHDNRIKLINNSVKIGFYSSCNKGLRISKGKYICYVKAEDISLSHRLESQFLFMQENREIGLSGCGYKLTGEQEYFGEWDYELMKVMLLAGNCFKQSTMIMRKELVEKYELFFNESYISSNDYDLAVRASRKLPITSTNEVLLHCTNHPEQITEISNTEKAIYDDAIRVGQLQMLNVFPSEAEKDIHLRLVRHEIIEYSKKKALLKWIDKLRIANYKAKKYDCDYLDQLIESLLSEQLFIFPELLQSNLSCCKLSNKTKSDLSDVTFVIPLRIESNYRKANLEALLETINRDFITQIIIIEADKLQCYSPARSAENIDYYFLYDDDPVFHRTKYINKLIKLSGTPYVGIWDTDAITPMEQINVAIEQLRQGKAMMSFPYNGQFHRTDKFLSSLYHKYLEIDLFYKHIDTMLLMDGYHSVGGAFFVNKEVYLSAGGENENFYGWGPEDKERVKRMELLNLPVYRADGPMFHLWHPRGQNSWFLDKKIEIQNRNEFLKTCSKTKK